MEPPVPAVLMAANFNRVPMPDPSKPSGALGRRSEGLSLGGRSTAILKGLARERWRDPYHFLLTVPWWAFLALVACAYFVANALFAVLYLIDPHAIANAKPGSFWDAFFFSVQTIGTIGYGVMAPQTRYANAMAAIESFTGLLSLALVTGLIFARFSRPTARIMFSRNAVITTHDGVATLMFRAANERRNQILEADVTATLVRNVITPGTGFMRRLEELRVLRSRSPMFALSWTVMHPIDETSPLRDLDHPELVDSLAEVVVLIGGTDETLSQRIIARHTYGAPDILRGHRFADILTVTNGQRVVDYGRFHDVEPDGARV